MPATVVWTNPAGGDWAIPGNWSTGTLPGPEDDAVIDLAGVTVTHGTGTDLVRSLTGQSALQISGGTLGTATASALRGTLTLSGGTLGILDQLTVSGLFTWTGGTLLGGGHTRADGGLRLNGTAEKVLNGHTLENARTARLFGRTFDNAGQAGLAGTNFEFSWASVFNNLPGAVFVYQMPGDATLAYPVVERHRCNPS